MSNTAGVKYFPLDCILDDKFQLIEAEFGLKGFAVVVKLLQRIYGVQGYYCEWNDEVALLFGRECALGDKVVSEIVTTLIRRGFFNKSKFEEYGILTSKGIQDRYINAAKRRSNIHLFEEYLLINADNLSKNVCKSRKNVCKNEEDAYIFEQSKGKENKGKNSICANEICASEESLFEVFWKNYPKKRSKQVAKKAFDKLKANYELTDKIMASVEEHQKTYDWEKENGQFIPYPATFLNQKMWLDEDLQKDTNHDSKASSSTFSHDYDLDEMERILFGE